MEATGQLCARARFWASLRIDGELSELEGALLDAHLARCAECRAITGGFVGATRRLRAQPLELAPLVEVAGERTPRRALLGLVAATLVIFAALLGGLARGQLSSATVKTPHPVAVVASAVDTPDQLRELRRTTLLNQRPIPREISAEPV
jgi:anti-sigma factor RsiW